MEQMYKRPQEVRELLTAEADYTVADVPIRELEYEQILSGHLVVKRKGDTYVIKDTVARSVCSMAGVPYAFLQKCNEELQKEIFGTFFREVRSTSRFISRGIDVVEIQSTDTPYLNNLDIFDRAIEVVDDDVEVAYSKNESCTVFDIVGPKINKEVRKGDIIRGGVSIGSRRTGKDFGYNIFVNPLILRLVCTNGMLGREEDERVVNGMTWPQISANIHSRITEALKVVGHQYLEQYGETNNVSIGDPASYIHGLSRDNALPARTEALILDRVPELKDPTLYDVLGLITNVANNRDMTLSSRRQLQRMGGVAVESIDHRCTSCKRVL